MEMIVGKLYRENKTYGFWYLEKVAFDGKYFNVFIPSLGIAFSTKDRKEIKPLSIFLTTRFFNIRNEVLI